MKQIVVCALILSMLPGCLLSIGSVYPFFSGKSTTKIPTGTWKFTKLNFNSNLNISTRLNFKTKINLNTKFNMDIGKSNLIPLKEHVEISFSDSEVVVSGENYTSYFSANYCMIGKELFVNMFPIKDSYGKRGKSKIVIDEDEYLGETEKTQINTMGRAFCARINILVKINLENDQLSLATMEAKLIKKVIKENKLTISFRESQGRILFTDSSEKLFLFIQKYKNHLFSKNISYLFKKVSKK
ncbi:hypothetical protein [Candidatus Uabimicrobium sp. HlEnr_7]|uniref:hypothetical protein n=1 Tax=Candidatus Uabimicrobium helgolandensis TaxID=3095367 RepID=UPI003556DCBE